MLLREFVAQLTDAQRHEAIRRFEQFEQDGQIGDESLRLFAKEYMRITGIPHEYIVTTMTQIAFECYRYYYNNQTPVAWVPCGDINFSPDNTEPNWQMVERSAAQAQYWVDECFLRVRPLYLGEPTKNPKGSVDPKPKP